MRCLLRRAGNLYLRIMMRMKKRRKVVALHLGINLGEIYLVMVKDWIQ
jgi:hypothetical protein